MIARDLDFEIYSSSNYNLITEDNIQKIIFVNVFPKVPLLFQTQFSYLVDKYTKDYVIEKKAQKVFEKHLLDMLSRKDIKNILYIYIFIYLSPHIYLVNKKKLQYIKYIYTIQMVVNSIE